MPSVITAGIDIGSTTAQAVLFGDSKILAFSNIRAGADRVETAEKVLELALKDTEISRKNIKYIIGTGYGRYLIPFTNKNITEITCHARGANYFFPRVHTVLDMGGQDCKVIKCGENGKVRSFVMNDKCAAGTGRSMEVISRLMGIPLEEIGPLSLDIRGEPPRFSSSCVIFAKSEALKMIRSGISRNEVLAAYCNALVQRVNSLILRVGLEEELVISGGIAKNSGVVQRLEKDLAVKARICFEPQIVGALGAAIIAQKLYGDSLSTGEGGLS
jgi:bzd-type benzoyl-CoA reductase Q subunit